MKNLSQIIKKARNLPALAHIYALEADRQLRAMGKDAITFSAHGLAEGSIATARILGLDHLFTAQATPEGTNAIYHAEILVKEGKRSEAIAHAFAHAQGPQVNSLNLFYATHATQRPEIRRYYLNKYLSAFGLRIELEQGENTEFFYRLKSGKLFEKVDGPLVTVIMPAHNAEATIELAVNSLLNQSWHKLQIIIVDDASTDSTLQKAKAIAKRDPRVEVLSNPVNVGPYVSRNLGVLHTRGEWLTVHDADDWAFPDRVEQQVKVLKDAEAIACTGGMLRIDADGQITRLSPIGRITEDGYQRLCFVSLMVQTEFFRKELGAWDSVRVGGDAEMIDRLKVLGVKNTHLGRPLMLCLDHAAGLTNHVELGLLAEDGHVSKVRSDYRQAFDRWHQSAGAKKLSPYAEGRAFEVSKANQVEQADIDKVFSRRKQDITLIKKSNLFNQNWYVSKYPRASKSVLEPAEHYLVYGAAERLDPGPDFCGGFYLDTHPSVLRSVMNPLAHHIRRNKKTGKPSPDFHYILWAAHNAFESGRIEQALELAEEYLPDELKYTANIIKANKAIINGNELGWLSFVNGYLSSFNLAPITLSGEGNIFSRLNCSNFNHVDDGELVTVIMPAWNAGATLHFAAKSILNQTWRNLELLIIDDASEDNTWDVMQEIAATDSRVRLFKNYCNVGPYVSKNIVLKQSKGDWITGHDADDWAHPQRIELQVDETARQGLVASLAYMIRMRPDGFFGHIGKVTNFSFDGVARKASISCLFKRDVLIKKLGFWDSVRFGADSEMIARAETLLGVNKMKSINQIGMICLDAEGSLTNHPVHGVHKVNGVSPIRSDYRTEWSHWHNHVMTKESAFLPFPQKIRRYKADPEMVVPYAVIEGVLDGCKSI